MSDPCLTFKNLTLGYAGRAAVHHLNGDIAKGSLTAVVGANGSGKSTLMKGIAGILKPLGGECRLSPNLSVAYLPQQSELDRSFPAQVRDLVALGLWPKRGLFGRHRSEDRAAMGRVMEAVGLSGFEKRNIDSLSGGQMQRALFARAMLQDAQLILLDEPFNAVDEKTVADLMVLIKSWVAEGRTVLAVLHDFQLVRQHFPETLFLARKLVGLGPTAEVLKSENIRQARHFHEAWEENAPWCDPAEAPSLQIVGASPHAATARSHSHDHSRANSNAHG
ncbi:zinc ABC transporter ATP-binding protein AztA [Agrobacterium salinitolerans]|uniref:Metal ABC transporter ATP-binding protein n=1 Tax=Agrobacterium salinitolerans TaxID=1183413 RepID=A0A9X3KP22_9HYPH|nr:MULTISPECIES: zinc ABC transporter ATP-binding protein AztA [Agrobacterium]MCZ7852548.1 zinc ABC transporter ATP-binding protein AztA [Agrobacterium salinitolerans]MCZ7893635.1 zinc ABC transporter ATP-binding protein AztA [Agrobacterium salinitolerans]MCZ7938315.1 zinc ABC transporter ATP-binding protein AztA [Agrobacterium salinitolerans]MCZ7976195.1 zinc ABC transporter ATP-binding protein AztA [Agrobacterium salinitolerans]TRA84526.1 metal ABC transporter ATP-binding protein [Agrobacter